MQTLTTRASSYPAAPDRIAAGLLPEDRSSSRSHEPTSARCIAELLPSSSDLRQSCVTVLAQCETVTHSCANSLQPCAATRSRLFRASDTRSTVLLDAFNAASAMEAFIDLRGHDRAPGSASLRIRCQRIGRPACPGTRDGEAPKLTPPVLMTGPRPHRRPARRRAPDARGTRAELSLLRRYDACSRLRHPPRRPDWRPAPQGLRRGTAARWHQCADAGEPDEPPSGRAGAHGKIRTGPQSRIQQSRARHRPGFTHRHQGGAVGPELERVPRTHGGSGRPGVGITLALQRALGLRESEAIRCGRPDTWALANGRQLILRTPAAGQIHVATARHGGGKASRT